MLNKLDTFKIMVIKEVALSEGITEAAKRLGVSPPAVSQCIRNVEKDLKRQLFVRIGKKLKATPFTLSLCERATVFFDSIQSLLNSENDGALSGHLRFGAPPAFGADWIVPKLTEFLKEHPQVKASLTLVDTRRLLSELISYKLDFIFIDGGNHLDDYPQVSSHNIFPEELVMCASKKFYHKNIRGNLEYKQLLALDHIPYHEGKEAIHKWYHHHYGKSGNYRFSFTVDTAAGVLSAIKTDFGMGVVPLYMIEKEIKSGELKIIEGKKKSYTGHIVCSQLMDKVPSKTEKEFIKLCQSKSKA